jgi:hypothetical protein
VNKSKIDDCLFSVRYLESTTPSVFVALWPPSVAVNLLIQVTAVEKAKGFDLGMSNFFT